LPADRPETTPDADPTAATETLLLLHVPPADVLLSVVVAPTHTTAVPVMEAGRGLTVKPVVVLHPVGSVYVIVTLPETRPLTMPLDDPIVATDGLLLVHVPPVLPSVKVTDEPAQTLLKPDIAAGAGLTVTTVSAVQPPDNV